MLIQNLVLLYGVIFVPDQPGGRHQLWLVSTPHPLSVDARPWPWPASSALHRSAASAPCCCCCWRRWPCWADRLAPYNPLTADYAAIRDPPLARHVLGTDHLGRDVLSRIIFGARVTLLVAISSVLLGDTIGFIWGAWRGLPRRTGGPDQSARPRRPDVAAVPQSWPCCSWPVWGPG